MKEYKIVLAVLFIYCVIFSSTGFCGEKDVSTDGKVPKAEFPELLYTFNEVLEGDDILHDFIVKNVGDAVLEITKVKPG